LWRSTVCTSHPNFQHFLPLHFDITQGTLPAQHRSALTTSPRIPSTCGPILPSTIFSCIFGGASDLALVLFICAAASRTASIPLHLSYSTLGEVALVVLHHVKPVRQRTSTRRHHANLKKDLPALLLFTFEHTALVGQRYCQTFWRWFELLRCRLHPSNVGKPQS
jgi:hypothetical protein